MAGNSSERSLTENASQSRVIDLSNSMGRSVNINEIVQNIDDNDFISQSKVKDTKASRNRMTLT